MIEVRDLSIGYDGVPILRNMTFDVTRGQVFVVLGESGCGKTTLFRHMIGLDAPIGGTIRIEGLGDPAESSGPPGFGVMFQSSALFSSLTLAENVSLPLRSWTDLSEGAIEAIALARLRLVGLGGFENHLPADLSGGMRKRGAIARALALEPPLLFLDEPSAGLDPVTAVELDDLIIGLRDDLGVTSVIVTHELASIFRIANTCLMLDRDSAGIIAYGSPQELRDRSTDARVQRFFNREPRGVS